MTADTEGLERELVADLGTREERLADVAFAPAQLVDERQAHREAEESRGRAAPVEGRGDGG